MSEAAKPDRFKYLVLSAAIIGGLWYLNAHPEVLKTAPKPPARLVVPDGTDPRDVARRLEQEAEQLVQETLLDERAALQAEFRQIDRDLKEGILQLQKQASERRKDAAGRKK